MFAVPRRGEREKEKGKGRKRERGSCCSAFRWAELGHGAVRRKVKERAAVIYTGNTVIIEGNKRPRDRPVEIEISRGRTTHRWIGRGASSADNHDNG